ncbi:MAG: cellulase family glycosylhydrolase [Oscillospiraceae bacterium]|nr:cellulase family glycosylhydrolase [Oscillospiraceae bacterium]
MKKRLFLAILVLTAILGCTAHAYMDVSSDKWYYKNIQTMSDSGLLKGYDDNTFRPDNPITYAEFVSVLKRCVSPGSESSLSGHWAKGAMEYAYSNGWYDYDEINESLYDTAIPRYMAVKLTVLSMNLPKTENDDGVYWRYMNEIKDFNSIDGRYGYLVIRAYNNGVLTGDENGNFNPRNSLTRAEACAIISRAAGMADIKPSASAEPDVPIAPQISVRGGVSENGKLQVIGTQLSNERGEPVVLRGMSSHGLQWFSNFTDRASIAKTAQAGANVFRLAMYTGENGYLSQPDNIKNKLYSSVDGAIAEDMYVIIDWHILSDGNPMTNVAAAESFFNEVSAKYSNYDNVIYEICNEPNGNISWSGDVKPYAERIIPVIRANDPESVILVGSPTWSQDINAAADDPLNFDNVMYTCHFYAGTHTQWLRDWITYAIGKGAPIFISEWGTSAADGNGGVFLEESQRWLEFLNANNISWVNWSLCDKNEASAAIAPNTGVNWSTDTLSQSGKFVFDNFR